VIRLPSPQGFVVPLFREEHIGVVGWVDPQRGFPIIDGGTGPFAEGNSAGPHSLGVNSAPILRFLRAMHTSRAISPLAVMSWPTRRVRTSETRKPVDTSSRTISLSRWRPACASAPSIRASSWGKSARVVTSQDGVRWLRPLRFKPTYRKWPPGGCSSLAEITPSCRGRIPRPNRRPERKRSVHASA
jgi:hypothetical protein